MQPSSEQIQKEKSNDILSSSSDDTNTSPHHRQTLKLLQNMNL